MFKKNKPNENDALLAKIHAQNGEITDLHLEAHAHEVYQRKLLTRLRTLGDRLDAYKEINRFVKMIKGIAND